MDLRRKLGDELRRRSGLTCAGDGSAVVRYLDIARGYAAMEGVIAVLSNIKADESVVVYGGFSKMLDIDATMCDGSIPSLWEDDIFRIVHPDDLEMKLLRELLFFHHINKLPPARRCDRWLAQRLRMRGREGGWVDVLHRLRYIPDENGAPWLAMCLYGAMTMRLEAESMVVDMPTGRASVLDRADGRGILSRQEIAVLRLVDSGNRSKAIAGILNISVHTVSRHRQNILSKLKVRNSTEACRVARSLSLI